MNERDFGTALRRYLDGFGPYDAGPVLGALAEPPRRRRWGRSLLASAAACLAVAAVVGIMLAPRWMAALRGPATPGIRPPATAPASAARPTATPAAPAALLVEDLPNRGWARLDWTGRKLGSFQPAAHGILTEPSPDGSLLLVYAQGGGLSFLSGTTGQAVGVMTLTGSSIGTMPVWADDSRHVCGVRATSAGQVLAVVDVDPATGRVQQRTVPLPGPPMAGTPAVDACSPRLDRAVLSAFTGGPTPPAGSITVIRPSDGGQVLRLDYPAPAPFVNVRVSEDTRYLVGSPAGGATRPRSTVVDLTTGQQVAQLDGVGMQFSSDDRFLAVSSFTSEVAVTGGTGSLVEWRTGRMAWQGQGQLAVLGFDPGGQAIAVQLSSRDARPPDHDRYLIVRPDGGAVTIKQNGSLTPTG
jgi:hypothetical protein